MNPTSNTPKMKNETVKKRMRFALLGKSQPLCWVISKKTKALLRLTLQKKYQEITIPMGHDPLKKRVV